MEITVPKYSIFVYRTAPFCKRLWNIVARLFSSSDKYRNEYIVKFVTGDLEIEKPAYDIVFFKYIGPDKTNKIKYPKSVIQSGCKILDNNAYEFEKMRLFDNSVIVPNGINYKTVICLMESLKNWQKNII